VDQQHVREILSGRRRGAGAALLRVGLIVPACAYASAMRLRRWAYRRCLLKSVLADVPVVCVGNITTGGTGKTPMVAWVVRRLIAAGKAPAILTRGYKARAGRSDEAELVQRLCNVPVIVDADRVKGASEAVERGAEVCVMDDGFQHLRLRRDLDIVLIDATNPFGYGWCLPRGLLREPLSALRDADAIVITHIDRIAPSALQRLRDRLAKLAEGASLHLAVHSPTGVIKEHGRIEPVEALNGRRLLAFCGLGNPEQFFELIRSHGAELTSTHSFDDHVAYTPEIAADLRRAAESAGCDAMITTQKDFVKLDRCLLSYPIWQLAMEMRIVEGEELLVERILRSARGTPIERLH